MSAIVAEHARETFVNGISVISKIGCPSSSVKELNLDSEIWSERSDKVVR